MTPAQRQEAIRRLEAFDFPGLFTDPAIGWDWPGSGQPLRVPFSGDFLSLEPVAEKRGVRILLVPPMPDGGIMPSDHRKKLENAVTPLAAEHLLIFADQNQSQQVWLWTSRLPGKPVRHRELTWEKGRANELLLQKLTSIAFTLDEEEGLDITGVVRRLRDNLDRDRLTRRFYDDFKRHKDQFQQFIKGIEDEGILAHYTSLMLNRLMFCYFLQQKGFLNGEQDYLRRRLEMVPDTLGENQFHSFYRSFLKRLFFDGLDGEERPAELTRLIGEKIPYLNGGIFAEHPIERDHPDIRIPDAAFEEIFDFFDRYHWHLDDRPLGNDREINPEVLGYVFEKYTNQKEMGAYYTKEDITEYISKNTILPFLLQKVAAKLPAAAWELLQSDPDLYIYPVMRHGAGDDEEAWRASLPENIAIGLDTAAPDLIRRRKDWNTAAPATHALPTEIWRETIARHQRCHELRRKLRAGEVRDPGDLVTLNLNIRQFVEDVIANAPPDLALALWKSIRRLSVLDPTCGSGAFLFAALEILVPLYEGLLQRFRILLGDWERSGEKHPNWEKGFRAILDAVARHPNEAYFIHKTLIVHNLYGVDIMEEAVEICKLRLFLKLAAQLEPGQEIEPLPDIDFNVRAGNTLVGYATRDEIKKAFTEAAGSGQALLQGIETSLDDYNRIMEQAAITDMAFQQFQEQQDTLGQTAAEFRTAKADLERRLGALRSELDRFLAGQYDQRNLETEEAIKKWRDSHEPFHWFVEFYGIMNSGGFDVIVGNPPYVEYRTVESYRVKGYKTLGCGDLYAFTTERACEVVCNTGQVGLIVPISLGSTDGFTSLQNLLKNEFKRLCLSFYSNRPSQIFEGAQKRLTILLGSKCDSESRMFCSRYVRFRQDERENLMDTLRLHVNPSPSSFLPTSIEKLGSPAEWNSFAKMTSGGRALQALTVRHGHLVFYTRKFGYFLDFLTRSPKMNRLADGSAGSPSELKSIAFQSEEHQMAVIAALSSSAFFWFWNVISDCRNLNRRDLLVFPLDLDRMSAGTMRKLSRLGEKYIASLYAGASWMTKSGWKIETFPFSESKPIIDQIDTLLAGHYGLTEEELDFIINYDIKYRMGLGS